VGDAGLADRRRLVGKADGLQDACDLMVEEHGPRQRIHARLALQDHDATPLEAEEDRGHLLDRAVADDRDVVGLLGVHRIACCTVAPFRWAMSSSA
jgi:hypothetical protein